MSKLAKMTTHLNILLLVIPLIISGCTRAEKIFQEHLGPANMAPTATEKTIVTDVQLTTLDNLYKNRFKIDKDLDNPRIDTVALKEYLAKFAPFVLTDKYIQDPRIIADHEESLNYALSKVNFILGKYYILNHAELINLGYLSQYEAIIDQNCNDSLRNCKRHPFFANDNLTAQILLFITREKRKKLDIFKLEKYRIIQALDANPTQCAWQLPDSKARLLCRDALTQTNKKYSETLSQIRKFHKLINDVLNPQFLIDYYTDTVLLSSDVFDYYSELDTVEKKRRAHEINSYREFINSALLVLKSIHNNKSRDTYCTYIKSLKPHTFDLNNPDKYQGTEIRELVSEFIRCTTEKKFDPNDKENLENIIRNYVKMQKEESSVNASIDSTSSNEYKIKDLSYYYALQFISKQPYLLKNLDISPLERNDLSFFVIDRLFYEAIDQKISQEYWNHVRSIDDLEFLKFVKTYIKVQITYLLKSTQLILGQEFENENKKRGSLSSDSYTEIVNKVSQKTSDSWVDLKKRINNVRNFLTPIYDKKKKRAEITGENKALAEYYNNFGLELDSLERHLNYLVTSPLMLVMSYYISKNSGPVKIYLSWLQTQDPFINVDGSKMLADFFDNKQSFIRFFNFGTKEDFNFDSFEMHHVFDIALRSGIFDTIPFGIKKEDQQYMSIPGELSTNNEWLFFRQYIKNSLKLTTISAANSVDKLDELLNSKVKMGRLAEICKNPLSAPITFSELSDLYENPLLNRAALDDIITSIYNSLGMLGLLDPQLANVDKLLDLLKNHFYSADAKDRLPADKFRNRDLIISKIKNELEPYYKFGRNLYSKVLELDNKLKMESGNDCLLRIHKSEVFRENTLYFKNVDYYKDVHAAIFLLNIVPEAISFRDLGITNESTIEAVPTPDQIEKERVAFKSYIDSEIKFWIDSSTSKALSEEIRNDILSRTHRISDIIFHPQIWSKSLIPIVRLQSDNKASLFSKFETHIQNLFSVHNVSPFFVDLPDKRRHEFGIYVDRAESFADSKILLTPKNTISKAGFRQTKRDTLLRIRRQLQTTFVNTKAAGNFVGIPELASADDHDEMPLAPGLVIPIKTFASLATDSLFTSDKMLQPIAFDPNMIDQTAFVRAAMSQLAGDNQGGDQFLSWHSSASSGYGISWLNKRFKFLLSLYEKGPIEISNSDKKECPLDEWKTPILDPANQNCKIFSVNIKDIVKNFMLIINQYRLDPSEMTILDWLGRTVRFQDAAQDAFKYKNDVLDASKWTYFDMFYKKYFTAEMAQLADGRQIENYRFDGKSKIEDLKESLKQMNAVKHIFPLQKYVTQFDRNIIRSPLLKQLDRVKEVEEAIFDIEENFLNIEDQNIKFGDFIFAKALSARTDSQYFNETWRLIQPKYRDFGPTNIQPIYLNRSTDELEGTESPITRFWNNLRDMVVDETMCFALPADGDPDFSLLSTETQNILRNESDCSNKYSSWSDDITTTRDKERIYRRNSIQ